jgi:HK97 family phage prohead protease
MNEQRPAGELEYRAVQQIGVSFPKRTIELIVMPYETETMVAYQGRMVGEIVSRGAFDGIERRANRIRVNRDHDVTRTVGRAIALHPAREEGLVGVIKIARTELGDETLTLADEEILDGSAGFLPMPGGEKWEHRARRRLTKCWLGHIALTPDPAYVDARVLAVRTSEADETRKERPATPNLDRLKLELLREQYAILERRYSQP